MLHSIYKCLIKETKEKGNRQLTAVEIRAMEGTEIGLK
jgi:hypothetical protein